MKTPISPLGVRLPAEIKNKIKASALVNRRSVNAEIVVALERHYENREKKKADAQA